MNIVFVSNYINHHQLPLSEELIKLSGGNYTFLATEPMSEERKKMGWNAADTERSFVKNFWEDPEAGARLIMDSDLVIFGGTEDEELVIPRLEAGKFTVRYNERLYKTGRWKFISPRGLKKKYYDHTRFRKSPVYLLCAGAYVKGDYSLIGAYPGKMLKFGYFPKTYEYENVHFKRESNEKLKILWAARFIDWKHPEMMLELAHNLKNAGIDFEMTLVGDGALWEGTLKQAQKMFANKVSVVALDNGTTSSQGNEASYAYNSLIRFTGAKTPDEVRELMLEADIFVSTSDSQEGWGAVVNEAMNSGCVTIAPREIGAAPYLIKNGENGFLFHSGNDRELFTIVKQVSDSRELREKIGTAAYKTITETWNVKVAAKRLWDFLSDPEHKIPNYPDGPMSKA